MEVRPIVLDIVVEKQQLKPTPEKAIGTTRRGTLPSGPYIEVTSCNVRRRHWSLLPDKQSGKG